jgi:predicted nucleic acid-binding protein
VGLRVALIHKGNFHRLARDFLDLFCSRLDLRPVLFIGGRYHQRQQMPELSVEPFHTAVAARLLLHRTDPQSRIITSRLSRLECRVQPLRNAFIRLLEEYDAFFSRERLVLSEVTAAVIERASDLRTRHNFKTPDAIHLATAIEEKADLFLTGDEGLARCTEVKVDVLKG